MPNQCIDANNYIINQMGQNQKELLNTCSSTNNSISSPPSKTDFEDLERKILKLSSEQYRLDLFENTAEVKELSQKLHQKAVSWLITICWVHNISQDTLWEALLLYYTYKAKKNISKSELELIMLACLSLAIKMNQTKVYSTKDIANLSSQSVTPADIVQMESVILELVDFNLIIPHQLEELYCLESISEEQLSQIMLTCQLLMIKDYSIFVNSSKLRNVFKLLNSQQPDKNMELFGQLKELLPMKQSKSIFSKYSSKMDVLAFKDKFN